MGLAMVNSRSLLGLQAPAVTVEVHLANGLPSFTLVGLADTEVKEARERVRCAIQNAGLSFPSNKRITVNLAPADLPKDSGRFDLPIAMGILAASGLVDAAAMGECEFAGELSLSGELRPVRGGLAMGMALAAQENPKRLVLPMDNAREAAWVPHIRVHGAQHLLDVVQAFAPQAERLDWPVLTAEPPRMEPDGTDMAEVKGQASAKRALQIAAAGGHSVLMIGPPGSGKSMLAQRFAGLLPPMDLGQCLESAAVASLVGRFSASDWGRRPWRNPHHTATSVALVGGGSPPRPGEISLAHHGVLFLDELPEFSRSALEALREPLETGRITISRAAQQAEFPARFQLIAAMNPCPCGHHGSSLKACRCTPDQVARYQGKLSGPLLDRIDLHVEVPSLSPDALLQTTPATSSPVLREACLLARERAMHRQGHANHLLQGQALDGLQRQPQAQQLIERAAQRLGWSGRGTHRCLRVARTVADLQGHAVIEADDVAEAMQYRRMW
jgi:magnesium chelatase family protein